jgi:hypothetical protein
MANSRPEDTAVVVEVEVVTGVVSGSKPRCRLRSVSQNEIRPLPIFCLVPKTYADRFVHLCVGPARHGGSKFQRECGSE